MTLSTVYLQTLRLSSVLAGLSIDESVVAATSVAVEPRLTCLVAWPVMDAPHVAERAVDAKQSTDIAEKDDSRPRVSFVDESEKKKRPLAIAPDADKGSNKKNKKNKK